MTVARIKYSKGEEIKYISHLDFQRSFYRLLNRAQIPVAFSQGFNPHPKVSFAVASPVGMTSEGEYLDVELTEKVNSEDLKNKLNEHAPKGLEILDVNILTGPVKSLSSTVRRGVFKAEIPVEDGFTEEEASRQIEDLLKLDKIEITQKNKKGKVVTKNIRPMIHSLKIEKVERGSIHLEMELSMGSKENLRPQALIDYLIENYSGFLNFPKAKLHRVEILFEKD